MYGPSGRTIGSYSPIFGPDNSRVGANSTIINAGGSGATNAAIWVSPFEALKMRAYQDGTAMYHDFLSARPLVHPASDACIVFGNAWASEGYDRVQLRDDLTDGLVLAVASQCSKTVVVLHNAGTRLVDQFVNHPNVSAIIFAHLPGQDSGPAITSLLYGDENFSGKLPYTVAKNESDYGHLLHPDQPLGEYKLFPQSDFDEGIYVDYRLFDKQGIEPRYEFGVGLSDTTFAYSRLVVRKVSRADTRTYPSGPVVMGGQKDLWDDIVTVSATVSNTGHVAGAEVAQVYVGIPGAPSKQLRGFEKPVLRPGQSATVQFELTRRDLSVWDTVAQKWKLQSGEYKIYVGSSSRNLALTSTLRI
jgi:beta-glucosidase